MVEKFVGVLPLRFRALPLDDMFSLENVKKVWSPCPPTQTDVGNVRPLSLPV